MNKYIKGLLWYRYGGGCDLLLKRILIANDNPGIIPQSEWLSRYLLYEISCIIMNKNPMISWSYFLEVNLGKKYIFFKLRTEAFTSTLGLLTDWLICPHNALRNLARFQGIKSPDQSSNWRLIAANLVRISYLMRRKKISTRSLAET